MWKDRSLLNTSFAKIYTSFWNSPEGSISVLLEPAKKGTLQVISSIDFFSKLLFLLTGSAGHWVNLP